MDFLIQQDVASERTDDNMVLEGPEGETSHQEGTWFYFHEKHFQISLKNKPISDFAIKYFLDEKCTLIGRRTT